MFSSSWLRVILYIQSLSYVSPQGSRQKKRIFYVSVYPPSYGQLFVNFFGVFFSQIMILCALKWTLHQKSDFHTTTRILNSSLLLLLLCHKTVRQRYSRSVKGIKDAFLRSLTMRQNVFRVSQTHVPLKKMGQDIHICLRSGLRWLTPLTVTLTVKYPFFDDFP